MRKLIVLFVVIFSMIQLNGCFTMPHHLVEKSAKFEEGKTTYNEIIQSLGNPQGSGMTAEGKRTIHYYEGYTKGSNRLEMLFTTKDVLERKMINKF